MKVQGDVQINTNSERAVIQTGAPAVPVWSLVLPVIALVMLLILSGQMPDGRLHLWVLDVGQGDAILLKTPKGHTVVIDGGPGATPLLNDVGKRIPFWQRDLDIIVLTSPKQEHMMGFAELLKRYSIKQVVQTEFTATSSLQSEWLHMVNEHGIPVHYAKRGDIIAFKEEPDVSLLVLNPSTSRSEDVNNSSLTLKLTYGKRTVLLTSSIGRQAESDLEQHEKAQLSSMVLNVPNHGSDSSFSESFLQAVKPQVAIISVGMGNKSHDPSPKTIEALGKLGAKIYRTDLNGTVEIVADKEKMWVNSER